LSPDIPNFIFNNKFYRLTEEYKQNSSSIGYTGGGLAKKSTYNNGNYSNYPLFADG